MNTTELDWYIVAAHAAQMRDARWWPGANPHDSFFLISVPVDNSIPNQWAILEARRMQSTENQEPLMRPRLKKLTKKQLLAPTKQGIPLWLCQLASGQDTPCEIRAQWIRLNGDKIQVSFEWRPFGSEHEQWMLGLCLQAPQRASIWRILADHDKNLARALTSIMIGG